MIVWSSCVITMGIRATTARAIAITGTIGGMARATRKGMATATEPSAVITHKATIGVAATTGVAMAGLTTISGIGMTNGAITTITAAVAAVDTVESI